MADASSGLAERSALGALLVLGSTLFFSLTGVLTKTITADAWTIAGWRGAVGGLIVLAYVVVTQKRTGRPVDLRLGGKGWLVAAVSAVSGLLFITSFKLTSVGNVVIIYATVPFMAAAISLLTLGERLVPRTMLASGAALGGVALTVSGSFGSGQATGDVLAVLMTFLCAIYLVMVRAFHDTPTVWASGVAALLLVVPGAIMGDFSGVTVHDGALMTLFGATFAAAVILWTEGARLIPPAEAGLLGAAEIPLALLFAWMLVGEAQTAVGFLGGAIVVAAVAAHALLDLRGRGAVSLADDG